MNILIITIGVESDKAAFKNLNLKSYRGVKARAFPFSINRVHTSVMNIEI